jgi:hypothetical protein
VRRKPRSNLERGAAIRAGRRVQWRALGRYQRTVQPVHEGATLLGPRE